MAYTLPAWQDTPSASTPASSANFLEYNAAINDMDSRINARVTGVTAGDSTITVAGTSTAPTVKVNQGNITVAESQVTNLTSDLAAITTAMIPTYSSGGRWAPNVYGTLLENTERDNASGTYLMVTGLKTQLVLLGLVPAGSYSTFKLYVTTAGTGSTLTAALYSASTLTNTSWARLGAGNVTPVVTATGLVSTTLAFTLASPAYVVLEIVLTTASTFPAFAATAAVPATLLNPASGCPVSGLLNASTAPAATLNPTTGFTAGTQKIWCALA